MLIYAMVFLQHGQYSKVRAMAPASRKRTVAIDHGTWRCFGASAARAEASPGALLHQETSLSIQPGD